MKKKQKVQIFKLEERVLFDGAAAAEIAAAVNQAGEQNQADDHSDNSEQDKEEKLIQNTVQNAGPVDTPAPDATVQNAGEGLPQADAAQNDPAEVLINGNADLTQVTDPNADFSGDVAEFIQSADPEAAAEAASHELIVIDSEAADQFDQDAFEGKNVLFLDGDSDAADQIENWLDEHSGQDINEVRLVTDSDTLASQVSDISNLDVTSVDAFQAELADSGDFVIVPDPAANITVDAPADDLPEELTHDAAEGRHELVIVNSFVPDIDNILEQLGDSRDVLVIDANSDAFEQITAYLDNSDTPYDAVHILSHGCEGGILIGSRFVNTADPFAVFSGHITAGSDIMLYGCNIAASDAGRNFIQSIADLTGADVAASVNTIGSASFDGNWDLEYASGSIETTSISLDSSWDHMLASVTVGDGGQNADLYSVISKLNLPTGKSEDTIITYVSGMVDDSMYTANLALATRYSYWYHYHVTITTNYNVTIKTPVCLYENNNLTLNGGNGSLVLEVSNGSSQDISSFLRGTVTLDSNASIRVSGDLDLEGKTSLSSASSITVLSSGTLNVKGTTINATDVTGAGNTSKVLVQENGKLFFENSTLDLGTNGLTANKASYMKISSTTINGTVDMFGTLELDGTNKVSLLRYENTATLVPGLNSTLVGNMVALKDFTLTNNFTLQGDLKAGENTTSEAVISLDEGSSITGHLILNGKSSLVMAHNLSIAQIEFKDNSTFTYTDGVKLIGSIVNDSPNVNFELDSTHKLTINGSLTMHKGSVNVNTDTQITDLILDQDATFDFADGITFTGNIDNGVSNIALTSAKNMTVTGELTMRKGWTFTLGADAVIGTLNLDTGSIFSNTAASTFTGNIKSAVDMDMNYAVTLTSGSLDMSNTKMNANGSLTLDNYTVSSSSIINIKESLTLNSSKVYGVVNMDDGTSYNMTENTTIGKLVLMSGSTLTYNPGITLYGGIDFYEGATIYANGSADPGPSVLTLDSGTNLTIAAVTEPGTGKVIPGQLIMEEGTTLNLNTDVTIGTIVLMDGVKEFNYGNIKITGNLDNYLTDIVLDEGYNLEITGSLIMEKGTKLTLNVNPKIGNLVLMDGSEFEYAAGVTREGSFESYSDLEFKESINFKDGSLSLHSDNGIIVDPGVTLTLTDINIIVEADSDAVFAIKNFGEVDFYGTNSIEFLNDKSFSYSAIINSSELNLVKDTGISPNESLTIKFTGPKSGLVKNGILNDGANAVLTIEAGNLAVNTYPQQNQTGYAINNTQGEVIIRGNSEVKLSAYGTESSAIFNAMNQTVTIGTEGAPDGSRISVDGNDSAYQATAISNNGILKIYNSYLSAENGLTTLTDSNGSIWLYNGETNINTYAWVLNGATTYYSRVKNPVGTLLYLDPSCTKLSTLTVLATGDSSVGLFNASNGDASFVVDQTPDQYIFDLPGMKVTDNIMLDFSKLIYSISGEGYSVINQNTFTTNSISRIYSGQNGTLIFNGVPVAALNGNVKQINKSSEPEHAKMDLVNMTINGNVGLVGNALIKYSDFYLNGNLINEGNNVYLTGKFASSDDFSVTYSLTKDVYNGSYTGGITVINREFAPASYGNIYLGDPEKVNSIVFSSDLDYGFFNYSGEMFIYNFTGLGSDYYHPVTIYNSGTFRIDNNLKSSDSYDIFVKGLDPADIVNNGNAFSDTVSSEAVFSDNTAMRFFQDSLGNKTKTRADGIDDLGIVNFNTFLYSQLYPVVNSMEITDLNMMNTRSNAAALTSVAGNLSIVRGSLLGSYSGIDLLVKVDNITSSNAWYVITPNTVLTDLTVIAGGGASIRNSGQLTLNGDHVEGGTLLTNNMDFGENYGEYVAFANYTFSVYMNEYYESSSNFKNELFLYGYSGIQYYEKSYTYTVQSATPVSPEKFNLYYVLSDDPKIKVTIDHTDPYDTYTRGNSPVLIDWHWGNYSGKDANDHLVSGYSLISGIAFKSNPSTGKNTAIRNWGEIKISGINEDPDYQFSGFAVSIDNGFNTYWADEYAWVMSGFTDIHLPEYTLNIEKPSTQYFTVSADATVGFGLSAASIKTSDLVTQLKTYSSSVSSRSSTILSDSVGELTLRAVETSPGLYNYNPDGRPFGLNVEGANYVVYKTQTLTLVNFSVTASKTLAAIENFGTLNVYNGIEYTDSGISYWKGSSNASIAADGTGIINRDGGFLLMFNGAILDSNIAIDNQYGAAMAVVNSTFYNNDIGIVSDAGSPGSGTNAMNLVVADTTIVSSKENSVGIKLTRAAGQLDMVNTIILVNGGDGLVNEVGAKVNEYGSENVVGTKDTTSGLVNAVYGTDFNSIDSMWDSKMNVLYLADSEVNPALTGGIAVSYTVSGSSYVFTFGGSSTINITWDKAGNARDEEHGTLYVIGSFVKTVEQPSVVIQVNTLFDSYDVEKERYSLRYVIDYLQSKDNIHRDTEVNFAWDKLIAEAAGNTTLQFEVTEGSLNVSSDNEAGISYLRINVSDFVDPSSSVTAIVIGNDGMAASLFTISGMAVSVRGTSDVTFTVNGSGTGDASVNVNGAAFNLADAKDTSLNLSDVIVSGGNTTGDGGAVYIGGSNVSVTTTGTTFSGNAAANGGAIYNNGGTLTVSGPLSGNTATGDGGAIYNTGANLTVSVALSGNTAGGDGGAIYNTGAGLTVSGALSKNTATGDGGAIYNTGANLKVSSPLSENTAGGDGGAIYNTGAGLTVSGTLSKNTATGDGGAIYNTGTGLTVSGTLSKNTADGSGGGLYNTGDSLTVSGNLNDNTAGGMGGGLYTAGTAAVTGNVSGNSAKDGAGIYNTASSLNVTGNLTGNTATGAGGGIYNSGTVTISSTVSGNSAEDGAGIYLAAGSKLNIPAKPAATSTQTEATTVTETETLTIINNIATGKGGGLYLTDSWSLDGDSVSLVLTGNQAVNGGAIYADGQFTVSNMTFSGNGGSGTVNGGAIYANGLLRLTNVTISGNEAENGSALYLMNGALMNTVTIKDNTASGNGTVYLAGGTLTIDAESLVIISGNIVKNGGAVYVGGENAKFTWTLDDKMASDLTGNAVAGDGGIIYNAGGSVTIAGGIALTVTPSGVNAVNGGAIYNKSGSAVVNADLKGFRVSGSGGAVYNSGILTVTGNLTENTASGDGGALYNAEDGSVSVTGTMSGNQAANGGAIYNKGIFNAQGNIASNTANNGAGIYLAAGGSLLLTGALTIDSNTASVSGGGIYAAEAWSLNDSRLTLKGNQAKNGGAIYADKALSVSNMTIAGNGGENTVNGGAIYANGSLSLTNVTIGGEDAASGNTAANGSALYLKDGASFSSVTIRNNTASGNGTVYLAGGSLDIDSTSELKITGNTAKNGGAVYLANGTEFTWKMDSDKSSDLNGNTATANGGMLYNAGATVIIDSLGQSRTSAYVLTGNTATGKGGVIYNAAGELTLGYLTMYGNTAADGSAVFLSGGTAYVFASTFAANTGAGYTVSVSGGNLYMAQVSIGLNTANGVKVAGGTAKIYNSVIRGNGSTEVSGLSEAYLKSMGTTITGDLDMVFKGGSLAEAYDESTGTLQLTSIYLNPAIRNGISSEVITAAMGTPGKFGIYDFINTGAYDPATDTVDPGNTLDQVGYRFYGMYDAYIGGARMVHPYITDLPWIVTTGQDVVDPLDGMTSLREAVKYVSENGDGSNIAVRFDIDAIKSNDEVKYGEVVTVTVTAGTLEVYQSNPSVIWALDADTGVTESLRIVSSMGSPLFTIATLPSGASFIGNSHVTIKGGTGGIFSQSGNTNTTVRNFNITLSTTTSGQTVTEDGPAFIVGSGTLNVNNVTVNSATSKIFDLTGGTTNIDGGSYRISSASTTNSMITADSNAVLNIGSTAAVDFSSPSTILTTSGNSTSVISHGTFTLNSGAAAETVMVAAGGSGTLTINDGTFTVKANDATAVKTSGSLDLSIVGGKFTGHNKTGVGVDASEGSGSFSVSGGSFGNFETGVKVNRSAAAISGGAFDGNIYGVDNSGTLTISAGSFQNNMNSGKTEGAGILNSGTLTVTSVTGAISGSVHGVENSGIIKSFAGTAGSEITISGSQRSGFYNTGTVNSMEYVILSDNGKKGSEAASLYQGQGGGLFNSGTIKNFNHIVISGNHAAEGGGIYNSGSIAKGLNGVSASDVQVYGNGAHYGGGVYWADGSYLPTDMFVIEGATAITGLGSVSTAKANIANYGGGFYVAGGSVLFGRNPTDKSAFNASFTFMNNVADSIDTLKGGAHTGGALFVASGASVTVMNTLFSDNAAYVRYAVSDNYDKYMYGTDTGNVDNVSTTLGGRGGAVYNEGTLTVMTSKFTNNYALGDFADQFPNYEIYLNTLAMGGAVYNAGTISVTDSHILNNAALFGLGGGVYNAQNATLSMASSEPYIGQYWSVSDSNSMIVEGNFAYGSSDGTLYAAGGFGGGIYADSGSTVKLDSVTIRNNEAHLLVNNVGDTTVYDIGRGGGLYFGEANVYVDALGTRPALGSGTLTIDGTVRNAEYVTYPAEYERMRRPSDISGNTAAVGAGLFTDTKGTVTVHNTEIHGNQVPTTNTLFTSADDAKDFYKVFWVTSEQSEYARSQQHSAPSDDALAAVGEQFTASGVGMYAMGDGATITLSNSKVGETNIPGVSIYGNNGTGSLGGGLYVSSDPFGSSDVKVTLQDSSVYGNSGRLGGGIYLASGSLTVTNDLTYGYNSSIHENSAEYGAGIYQSGGTLNVSYQAIYGNVLNNSYSTGSALYLDGGTAKIYNVTVASHTSGNVDAAAIYVAGGDLSVYNTTVGLNGTVGIRNAYGTVALYNTLVIGNGSTGYDNVVGEYSATASLVDKSAALIFGDNVFNPETGVIVLNQDSSNPALTEGALYADAQGNYYDQLGNDRTKKPGGEVYTVGALVGNGIPPLPPAPEYYWVVNTFHEDSNPSNDVVSLREAIMYLQSEYNTDKTVAVSFDYVALAKEADGYDPAKWAFILEDSFGSLQLLNSNDAGISKITIDGSFTDNTGATQVMTINGTPMNTMFTVVGMELALSNITVKGPAASTANGSVANVSGQNGEFLLNGNVTVTGGNTTGNGTIYVANGGTVTAGGTGNSIIGNSAANGGAIYVGANGNAALTGISITGNSATNGGAVYVANGGSANLTGNTISSNSATNGGALYNAGTATITGDITGNSAANGAGIFNTGSLTVNGNIANNTATGNGGALYNAGGTATVNGNVTGNSAANGAGIYMTAGNVTLNGDFMNNTASGDGAALYISGGNFRTNGNVTGNTGTSIIYADGGMAQFGSLDHYYVTMSGNTGILVKAAGGDVLIMNASIRGNNAGTAGLFEVSGGVLTTLNTTVTGNTGDVLNQTGGTVQIGDTTVYEPGGAVNFTGGTLNVLNSIINASNMFTATNTVGSLINAAPADVFYLDGGKPKDGANGTLQIKLSGKAGSGGVMAGYTQNAVRTTLYYTTDGKIWHDADGSAVSVDPASVTRSQNGAVRLYSGYDFLSIGAFSVKASLVVTDSGDNEVSDNDKTTLREALEFAAAMYDQDGQIHTVTFVVDKVDLNSTITVENPVAVSGSGVTISAVDGTTAPFAGDSVFVLNNAPGNGVQFNGLTIVGKAGSPTADGVRGIRVDGGDLVLNGVTITNGHTKAGIIGPQSEGGAIYVSGGGTVTGRDVSLINNYARVGAAIYSDGSVALDGFTVMGNVQTSNKGGILHIHDPAGNQTLTLTNGVFTGNDTAGTLIQIGEMNSMGVFSGGTAKVVSVSVADNGWDDYCGSSLLMAGSADIVNSTLTGNAANDAALVYVADDLNVANSIIVTSHGSGPAALAGSIKSAYSIYSGYLENVAVDVNNLTGSSFNELYSASAGGRLVPREDSPAAIGVWTMYNPATREIAYSERPEDIWTVKYKPENMQWHVLGGGLTSFNSAYLVAGNSSMPSIGANWIQSGRNHPDYGPGVDITKFNANYNGGLGFDWGYNSVVNGYLANPSSLLFDDTETGMGWYASMLSELFGFRTLQTSVLSVTGGIPSDELELSVDADTEDFGEFQEAPYRADDGTPLSQEELNAIRNAAVTGRVPSDSVHLDEAVHEKVAASLRNSELFKDSFDKALDALLGLDA